MCHDGKYSFNRTPRAGRVIVLIASSLVVAMAARGKRQVTNSDDSRLTFDEVANQYGGPVSEAPAITVKAHPEVIRVLPNMALEMQANPFTFAIGDPAQSVPWRLVQRSLRGGHLPIVIGTLQEDELMYEQVAFTTLLAGGEVKTGHEKQVATRI